MRSTAAGVFLGLFACLAAPVGLPAQDPSPDSLAVEGLRDARPRVGDRFDQAARLPVLDDAGNPIPRHEIEARMGGGGTGLVIGGLLGTVLGMAAGAALASAVSCGHELDQELCSPQERSLRDTIALIGTGVGMILGAGAGWQSDAVTWQEAVDRIRDERRQAAGVTP